MVSLIRFPLIFREKLCKRNIPFDSIQKSILILSSVMMYDLTISMAGKNPFGIFPRLIQTSLPTIFPCADICNIAVFPDFTALAFHVLIFILSFDVGGGYSNCF